MLFSIQKIQKEYSRDGQNIQVLKDISFDVPRGQFLSIVGPSGCGKTTLLRCIAGLTSHSFGEILFNEKRVSGPVAGATMVFQDYVNSLFPWKNVRDNVLFVMGRRGGTKQDKINVAMQCLKSVGLEEFSLYFPWELSGGMQQRLAIARALAGGAQCLLMDEPFASLDSLIRAELEDLLLEVWNGGEKTVIFVTHDIDEAIYMSDRILVMGNGITEIIDDIENSVIRPRHQLKSKAESSFLLLRERIYHDISKRAQS